MSKEPLTEDKREIPGYLSSAAQIERNQPAINLLHEWLADESGYDEQVWPTAKRAIAGNALSSRKRFDD
ncbi:MAG: hypothetical protein ACRD2L_04150 [Terriglobia bacterium]